jgi:hypothetical protein
MLSRIFRLKECVGPVSSATSLSDSNQMRIVCPLPSGHLRTETARAAQCFVTRRCCFLTASLENDIHGVSDRETWRAISQIRIFMTQTDARCSLLHARDITLASASIIANVWASWLHRNRTSLHLNGLSISVFCKISGREHRSRDDHRTLRGFDGSLRMRQHCHAITREFQSARRAAEQG